MNVQEVAAVLAYFGAAFPNMEISDDTADVWLMEVADIDPEDAKVGMREVVRTSDYTPTIAKFRSACHDARDIRTRVMVADLPALTMTSDPTPPPPEAKALAAKFKLRGSLGGGHWHAGPGPCPVCGGLPAPGVTHRPAVEIDKRWCSRCGEKSMPHSSAIAPIGPDSMQSYSDATSSLVTPSEAV